MTSANTFLNELNAKYVKLHRQYERLFWASYMGDHSVNERKGKAQAAVDAFKSNAKLLDMARTLHTSTKNKNIQTRLQHWIEFFELNQTPPEAAAIKTKIDTLETKIKHVHTTQKEGYTDPQSKKFVPASMLKLRAMMRTHDDETIRKACYDAQEKLALSCIDEYVELVQLRNQFAKMLGYDDFYDYKLRHEDKMTKDELFPLFENIAEKTAGNFAEIRKLAKTIPGLRKPWNFAYKMTGDFTKEEDPYFQFDQALLRWGQSFSALGIDFKEGELKLDLLDRAGKHNNGFCHWPELVHYVGRKRQPGSANFTCNVIPGQVGSGVTGYNTLFHEGGHAAHLLSSTQKDVCLNHEYAPMTAAWAETHSMFIDTMFSSIEWKTRYAKNAEGKVYPFELFARKQQATNLLKPARVLSVAFVSNFEKEVYELKNPIAQQIIKLAKKNYRRFYDHTEDSLWALNVPHIYAWDSACMYHGYGLAEIALSQWREYFYKKYGYIVDNKNVGKEMAVTWQWGASKPFPEAVKLATGKKLSSAALIKELNLSADATIKRAKKRLEVMEGARPYTKPVRLNAEIKMVSGKKTITTNKNGFEKMAEQYGKWVREQVTK